MNNLLANLMNTVKKIRSVENKALRIFLKFWVEEVLKIIVYNDIKKT